MEFSETKTVKTRKEHQCVYCLRVFPVGTAMEFERGKNEGSFYSHYTCQECLKYVPEFWDSIGYDCLDLLESFRDLFESFRDYVIDAGIDHSAFKQGN